MSQTKAQLLNPLDGNLNVTGIVTASSFSGDGSGLTGVASTDNIITSTPAQFLNNVSITGITTIGSSNGIGTVTIGVGTEALYVDGNARVIGILTVGRSSITLDGDNNTVNVGAGVTLDGTAGTIKATSFVGDGSGLTGAGSTVADDTSTNATFYPLFTQTTSGTVTDSKVSTTKLTFNPSSGTVTATTFSGALSGTSIDISGNFKQTVQAVSALNIDCSSGNYFTKTINANSTFTFGSVPSSRAYSFTLELTHTSGTVGWPGSVEWPSGSPPILNTGYTHLFIFVTDNGGSRWRGAALTQYTT